MNQLNETLSGLAVLRDWLGNGATPVTQEQADRRASACLAGNDGKECPQLRGATWLEEHSKEPIAQAIKSQLEKKSEMKLQTELDKHPRFCAVCGCYASLKAWVPVGHIAAHTPDDLIKKFPGWCWLRQEVENL